MRISLGSLALCLALPLVACGGGGNSFDSLETQLASPTGSIMETDTVIAADEKRQSSDSLTELNGFVPFSSGERMKRSLIFRSVQPLARGIEAFGGTTGTAYQPQDLGDPGDDLNFDADCFDDLFDDLSDVNISENQISASYNDSVNVADCSSTATGTIGVNLSYTIKGSIASERIDSISFKGTINYQDVCETVGDKGCIDGTIQMGAKISETGVVSFDEITILSTWDLVVSWDEGGTRQSVDISGGLKLDLSDNLGKVEILIEATSSAGDNVSYAFEVTSTLGAPFICRGVDGRATCTINQLDGSVSCNVDGGGTVTWTQEDIDRVTEDPSSL